MDSSRARVPESSLGVHGNGPDSPGSSVFDLPIQNTTPGYSRSTPHLEIRPPSLQTLTAQREAAAKESSTVKSTSFIVISGGTGGNAICTAFPNACYVLPVSDDGGSSSEIIRVLGGPSIGDIRSRLVRLIPPAPASSPLEAIRALLAYRLPPHYSERQARDEWREIVEGRSSLWNGIPTDRKETIRGFLVYFESELLKRAHKNFTFINGSIGNYFIAAAQGFFRSLPSAIFLFSSITNSQANILPVIVTNHTVTIAAELEDGERIVGQCDISHPVARAPAINVIESNDEWSPLDSASRQQNVLFQANEKERFEPLSSRISRLLYINTYGSEIHPSPNPDYLSNLKNRDVLVYSCGSLWTSIMPCLALRGVARAIAGSSSLRAKILLLNSENDRETEGYSAIDYLQAIARTLNSQYQPQPFGLGYASTMYPISAFVTDLVYLRGGDVPLDESKITALGVRCTEMVPEKNHTPPRFTVDIVKQAVNEILSRLRE
ncbi:hypothetical protein GYMLUDRAFT_76941 [Collybiopsis luxurians FD-317 M1]|uniref:Uncharacterized protein n=1 Tax=Collybiopsis luxurians FD-317 M1 TaxID=944289 RepID=A0A0D0C9G0_9AGAR|nr:hypothetical protein GYMLUDRAFT_76941 [Collybiopsis luxurians FD-317 M1]